MANLIIPNVYFLKAGLLDRLRKEKRFVYIDIVDDGRPIHPDLLGDDADANFRIDAVMTNDDFVVNGYSVAFVFARAKCSEDAIEKAVHAIAEDVANLSTDLYDLYVDANDANPFEEA